MQTTYLVWKKPPCNGVNPHWLEITGQEFYTLVRSPEGRNRYFIKLGSEIEDGSDDKIIIETTKAEYVKWRKEKDHSDYICEYQQKIGYEVVSYHSFATDDKHSGEEFLEDTEANVEADFLKSVEHELLNKALAQLSESEYLLIEYFYLSESKGTVRGYSAVTGIPLMTVQDKKTAVIKKLKDFFEK